MALRAHLYVRRATLHRIGHAVEKLKNVSTYSYRIDWVVKLYTYIYAYYILFTMRQIEMVQSLIHSCSPFDFT